MKRMYVCDKCGKQFYESDKCQKHEHECGDANALLKRIEELEIKIANLEGQIKVLQRPPIPPYPIPPIPPYPINDDPLRHPYPPNTIWCHAETRSEGGNK